MFDVKVEELKEEWVQLLQGYTHQSSTSNGHLPGRSGVCMWAMAISLAGQMCACNGRLPDVCMWEMDVSLAGQGCACGQWTSPWQVRCVHVGNGRLPGRSGVCMWAMTGACGHFN